MTLRKSGTPDIHVCGCVCKRVGPSGTYLICTSLYRKSSPHELAQLCGNEAPDTAQCVDVICTICYASDVVPTACISGHGSSFRVSHSCIKGFVIGSYSLLTEVNLEEVSGVGCNGLWKSKT